MVNQWYNPIFSSLEHNNRACHPVAVSVVTKQVPDHFGKSLLNCDPMHPWISYLGVSNLQVSRGGHQYYSPSIGRRLTSPIYQQISWTMISPSIDGSVLESAREFSYLSWIEDIAEQHRSDSELKTNISQSPVSYGVPSELWGVYCILEKIVNAITGLHCVVFIMMYGIW